MQPCVSFVIPFLAQENVGCWMVLVHRCPPCAPLEATSETLEYKEA
jgi:hypothetical protein